MPRRAPYAGPSQPIETPDGRIVHHGRQRDPRIAAEVDAHRAALAPRRWSPPAERVAG